LSEEIKLAHGGGGMLMYELISGEIIPQLGFVRLGELADSAKLEVPGGNLAFTTDGFVVEPLFFPGGDIGRLAVCGTVNDLAARGAKPIALSLGLIIEEGLAVETLRRVLASAAAAARQAEVEIVTGDTKVVEKGAASGLFVTTGGVGLMRDGLDFSAERIEPGDVLIVNGTVGDHGIAVMSVRQGLSFVSTVESDVAPLGGLVGAVLDRCGAGVKCMKDPTRGGLAANINEMARKVGFVLDEQAIAVRPDVAGACEMLGLDVLTVANEGKMLFAVSPEIQESMIEVLAKHELASGQVRMKTAIGGERVVETPYGEELPRIC